MSDLSNAYQQWLGIPPEKQPPDAYALLGLRQFESDLQAVQASAETRMAFLRTFQIGKEADLAQKLLGEVAMAHVTLLDPERKAAYDERLRDAAINQAEAVPLKSVVDELFEESDEELPGFDDSTSPLITGRSYRPLSKKKRLQRNIIRGVVALAALLLIIAFFPSFGPEEGTEPYEATETFTIVDSQTPAPPVDQPVVETPSGAKPFRPPTAESKTPGPGPSGIHPLPEIPGMLIRERFDITLPSGKTLFDRQFNFGPADVKEVKNQIRAGEYRERLQWDEKPVSKEHSMVLQKSGTLHGPAIRFFYGDSPKLDGFFYYGKLEGWLRSWRFNDSRRFWCQYSQGKRNGLGCRFNEHDRLRTVVEFDNGEIVAVHQIMNGQLIASSEGVPQADTPELQEAFEAFEAARVEVEEEIQQLQKTVREKSKR